MTNRDLLKEAIADAKAVKEVAITNAKAALEEAFTPHLKEMFEKKMMDMEEDEDEMKNEAMEAQNDDKELEELLKELEGSEDEVHEAEEEESEDEEFEFEDEFEMEEQGEDDMGVEDDDIIYEIEFDSEEGSDEELDEMYDDELEEEYEEGEDVMESKMTVKPKGVGMGSPKKKIYSNKPNMEGGFKTVKKNADKTMGTGKAKFEYKEGENLDGKMKNVKKVETKEASRTLGAGSNFRKGGLPKPRAHSKANLNIKENVDGVE